MPSFRTLRQPVAKSPEEERENNAFNSGHLHFCLQPKGSARTPLGPTFYIMKDKIQPNNNNQGTSTFKVSLHMFLTQKIIPTVFFTTAFSITVMASRSATSSHRCWTPSPPPEVSIWRDGTRLVPNSRICRWSLCSGFLPPPAMPAIVAGYWPCTTVTASLSSVRISLSGGAWLLHFIKSSTTKSLKNLSIIIVYSTHR